MSAERYGPLLRQSLREGCANLHALGYRTGLALSGIAIGCAAVVALLTLGQGAATQVQRLMLAMGSDLLVASVQRTQDDAPTPAALRHLPDLPPAIDYAAPLAVSVLPSFVAGRDVQVVVVGSTSALAAVLDLQVAQGRLLHAQDADSTYAVAGAGLARELRLMLGDHVRLGRYRFEVIGLLTPRLPNPLLPVAVNDMLWVSLGSVARTAAPNDVSAIVAIGRVGADPDRNAAALQRYVLSRAPGFTAEVMLPRQLLDGLAGQGRVFDTLLIAIALVALGLGGVGTLNVMVMSVGARRQEIGIRLALGARPQDIAWLFLLEAALLALAGAVAGAAVGMIAGAATAWLTQWPMQMNPWAVPLGMGSALVTGVLSGLQPALAAARLQPVTALREA